MLESAKCCICLQCSEEFFCWSYYVCLCSLRQGWSDVYPAEANTESPYYSKTSIRTAVVRCRPTLDKRSALRLTSGSVAQLLKSDHF